ncbi:MAG: sugar phosphate isomerase/epimerase [bacterium]|nr:sugar phosphate isomerase/epimerase [bacterium]
MKIGYGTYGMPDEDVFDALSRLKAIGYEAIEININDDWPTAPHKLDGDARKKLVDALQQEDFPPPVLMNGLAVCARGDARSDMLEKFDAACTLASDLNFGTEPAIVVTTLGGVKNSWDEEKQWICDGLSELADRSAQQNVILGIEPHVNHIFDTPEKSAWVMEQTNHDSLKLNFDMSHFHVDGFDLQHSIDLCAPYAVATHIKDGHRIDGKVQFQLPGEGSLDLVAYFKAVASAGLNIPITVEVSAQIFRQDSYNPWSAAEFCCQALKKARTEAGVT